MLNQNIHKTQIRHVSVNMLVTWDRLWGMSPELIIIQEDAKRLLVGPQDRVFWERYESLKRRMDSCVGMYAHPGLPEFMLTSQAYDLAHKEIFGRYV